MSPKGVASVAERKVYLLAFSCVLAVEVFIAWQVDDAIIRPYGGDTLAVVLVYTWLRALFQVSRERAVWLSLAIAGTVELSQYGQLVSRLGLEQHVFVRTVLGTTFHWGDMLAYALGGLSIVVTEHWLDRRRGLSVRPVC